MDPFKYAVIWFLPGLVFVILCLMEGTWHRDGWRALLWMFAILVFGPFFLVALASHNFRR